MVTRTLGNRISARFRWLACGLLLVSCISTPPHTSASSKEQTQKVYWKAVAKSDGRYYIQPRPKLSPEYPTPDAINNLTHEQAQTMAEHLNDSLQFNVTTHEENGESMIRIEPEPHLEDIVAICRQHPNELSIQSRCIKELKWVAGKARPDIYLRHRACEAVFFAKQLNRLYEKPQPKFIHCTPD